jgi:hypothetical protein
MSIYISLCCLGVDTELIKTIKSAKDNATNPEDIHIGIAFIGNKEFYEKVLEESSQYTNIVSNFYDLEENLGVGRGRSLATSMYNDQDYFLQVDAHTFFLQDWDTFLIERLSLACEETGNKKTVLSGFPGRYGYVDDEGQSVFWVDDRAGYPIYLKGYHYLTKENCDGLRYGIFKSYKKLIPQWNPVNNPSVLNTFYSDNNFIPLIKISAAFMFGNKFFGSYTGLDPASEFWEEEIIQSINLIGEGFSLVFSGPICPVTHMYSEDARDERGKREFYTDYLDNSKLYTKIASHFLHFIKNNKSKIKKYNRYIGFNILKEPKNDKIYKPKKYANSR